MKALARTMKALREVFRKNAGLRYGIVAATVMLVALCAAAPLLSATSSQSASIEGQRDEQMQQAQPEAPAYEGELAVVAEVLASRSWVTSSGEVVTFEGANVVTTSESGRRERTFELANASRGAATTQTFQDNADAARITSTPTTFVITIEGEPWSATLTESSDGTSIDYTLDCAGISSTTVGSTSSSAELALADGCEHLVAAVDGDEAALVEALRKWASGECPTATEASWDGVVTLDYGNSAVTFELQMNDNRGTSASVIYDTSTSEFTVY